MGRVVGVSVRGMFVDGVVYWFISSGISVGCTR